MKTAKKLFSACLSMLMAASMTLPGVGMTALAASGDDHVSDPTPNVTAETLAKYLLVNEDDLVPGSAKLTLADGKQVDIFEKDHVFWEGTAAHQYDDAIKIEGGGIILSTGDATQALNGKNQEAQGGFESTEYQDEDMQSITNSTQQYDTVALEFDVNTSGNMMVFDYVFASNEFDQKKDYKDTFGLFVNGKNIAKVNGRDDKIMTIDSLKDGQPEEQMADNEFYKVNKSFETCGFDGVSLVNRAYGYVEPDSVAHVKLVLSDFEDSVFDSAVFVKGHSVETRPGIQAEMTQRVDDGLTTTDRVQVEAGDTLNYAITLTNIANVAATGVKAEVVVPYDLEVVDGSYIQNDGTLFEEYDGTYDEGKRTITWDVGDMDVNEKVTLVYSVVIPETDGKEQTWAASAHVTSTNNIIMDTNTLYAVKDGIPSVTVSKSQSVNGDTATTEDRPINPGDEITYYITIYNNGEGTAHHMMAYDTIPEELELVAGSISNSGEMTSEGIEWNLGKMEPGTVTTLSYKCTARESDDPGAQAPAFWGTSARVEFNTSNDTYDNPVVVWSNQTGGEQDGTAILAVSVRQKVNDTAFTNGDVSVVSGNVVTYEINVVNTGMGTASNVEVNNPLPDGMTLVEGTVSEGGTLVRGDVRWFFEKMAAGETKTLSFKCLVPDTEDLREYKNSAYVTYTHANAEGTVSSQSNEVLATKDGLPVLKVDGSMSLNGGSRTTDIIQVKAGDKITYYMTVRNEGKGVASEVTLVNTVPSGLKLVDGSATESPLVQGDILTWKWDMLKVGESVTVSYTATVPTTTDVTSWVNVASLTYRHTNIGTVSSVDSNEMIAKKDGYSQVDLEMKQGAGNSVSNDTMAVQEGTTMHYTVTLTNSGDGEAQDIFMYALIPAGMTLDKNQLSSDAKYMLKSEDGDKPEYTGMLRLFDIGEATESEVAGIVYWELGDMKAGEEATREFFATIEMGGTATKWNTRAVATYGMSNDVNDVISKSNEVTAGISNRSDLVATMTQTVNDRYETMNEVNVQAGDVIYYTITVKNPSDSAIDEILVVNEIPEGLTIDSSSISNDGVVDGGGVSWVIRSLDADDSRTLTYKVTVPDGVADGTTWESFATVSAANLEDVTTNSLTAVFGKSVDDDQNSNNSGTNNGTGTGTGNNGTGTGTGNNGTGTGTGNNGTNNNGTNSGTNNGYQYNPNKDSTVKPGTGVEENHMGLFLTLGSILTIGAAAAGAVVLYMKKNKKGFFKS